MQLIATILCTLTLLSCNNPGTPEGGVVGDKTFFNFYMEENSGMAYSTATKKLYIIEDSGNPARVWVVGMDGKKQYEIELPVDNDDWEAAAYYKGRVYVADIGDNSDDKGTYHIHHFSESDHKDFKTIEYKYEDGATNAEGMAINPINGDIYITSKKYDTDTHTLYKLTDGLAKKVFNFESKSVGALSITTDGKLFVVVEDDTDKIRFLDMAGKQTKIIKNVNEGSKESLEVINDKELIYSAEGLEYFRTIKF